MLSSLRNIRFASSKPTIFIAPLFRCQMFVAVNAMAMTVADVVVAAHIQSVKARIWSWVGYLHIHPTPTC